MWSNRVRASYRIHAASIPEYEPPNTTTGASGMDRLACTNLPYLPIHDVVIVACRLAFKLANR